MNKFKISRITSKFDKGMWNIYQFGYDDDGKFVTKVDKVRDYFYYSADNIEDIMGVNGLDFSDTQFYDSFYGEKVNRVYYNSIKNRNEIARKYPTKTYEADISAEFKFMLDKKLEWSDKRHKMYYDIECHVDGKS